MNVDLIFLCEKMLLFLFVAVFLSPTVESGSDHVCCPDIGCYYNHPKYVGLPLPECQNETGITMRLYTRQDPTIGQAVNRDNKIPSTYIDGALTWFVVHGWLQNGNFTWLHNIKDSALAQGDYNVIIVNWDLGAGHIFYPQSASDTRTNGGEIAFFSNNFINSGKSSRSLMYCVGHSLGAHSCGQAGLQGQFGRITALDPAGPMFVGRDLTTGLSPSSADLVDVIHTDGYNCGMLIPVGHIDFYPNHGHDQPGCVDKSAALLYNWNDFTLVANNTDMSSLQAIISCSHTRAHEYFLESIPKPAFLSRYNCNAMQLMIPGGCLEGKIPLQSMGFYANQYQGRGMFYLDTDSTSPYSKP